MKKFWFKKALMFTALVVVITLVVGLVVMGLWNAILPAVLGVTTITYWQALGIFLLSKILFGSFGSRFDRRKQEWKEKMKEKCSQMSPEDREKFKNEWKTRCGGGWPMGNREEAGKQPQ